MYMYITSTCVINPPPPTKHDNMSIVVATANFFFRFCRKIKVIYCSTMKQPRI